MKNQFAVVLMVAAILSLAACADDGVADDQSAHVAEVMEWRETRLASLLEPFGYLNQTGLFWLEPGEYSFGSDASNDLVFAGEAAAHIGVLKVQDSGIVMEVKEGVLVHHLDEPVSSILMLPDSSEDTVIVTHGSLAWNVVEREGRFGIRLRDFELPHVKTFGPLRYFEFDPAFRVEATLLRYPEPIIARTETVIEGLEYRPESPGVARFEIDGEQMELEAYTVGERLFYVFGDLTNRDATYGAGRFVYSVTPGEDGKMLLDFNKSYSPPCAFNDFSTCPIATPRNTMAVRIEAGELYDESLHFTADH